MLTSLLSNDTDVFDQRGTVDFLSLAKKKKKKYNHFKTFLKHLTQHTIDFVMKKHDIFDKTLMKTYIWLLN